MNRHSPAQSALSCERESLYTLNFSTHEMRLCSISLAELKLLGHALRSNNHAVLMTSPSSTFSIV
jgi:hypothetical protein